MNKHKVYFGIGIFLVGIVLFFFEQTRGVAPLPPGFGIGFAATGINKEEKS